MRALSLDRRRLESRVERDILGIPKGNDQFFGAYLGTKNASPKRDGARCDAESKRVQKTSSGKSKDFLKSLGLCAQWPEAS